jgi:hypothetical protein
MGRSLRQFARGQTNSDSSVSHRARRARHHTILAARFLLARRYRRAPRTHVRNSSIEIVAR